MQIEDASNRRENRLAKSARATPRLALSAGFLLLGLVFSSFRPAAANESGGTLLYPPPDEIVANKAPVIGADFRSSPKTPKPDSLRLTVDRSDVTALSEVAAGYIFFKPQVGLLAGEHTVRLDGSDPEGRPLEAIQWKFFIRESFEGLRTYPLEGAELQTARPMIGANFAAQFPDGLESAALFLDGKDMSAFCDAGAAYIFFTPEDDLAPGPHEAEIVGRDREGRRVEGIRWRFSVAGGLAPAPAVRKSVKEPAVKKTFEFETGKAEPAEEAEREVEELKKELFGPKDKPEAAPAGAGIAAEEAEKEGEEAIARTPRVMVEHAYDVTFEWESVSTSGNKAKSFKREESGLNYVIGLRSVGSVSGTSDLISNLKIRGFGDPDISERSFEILSYTGTLDDSTHKLWLYEIDPRFSPYSLNGQRIRGGRATLKTGEEGSWDIFKGSLKNPRSGKHVEVSGVQANRKLGETATLSLGVVNSDIKDIRTLATEVNKVYSLSMDSRFDELKVKGEIARTFQSGLEADEAWNVESSLRKGNVLYALNYEKTGEYVRSEAGSIPKGVKDFSFSYSNKISSRLRAISGYKIRTLSNGSRTKTLPVNLTFQPFASMPDLEMKYEYSQKKNAKDGSRRNTRVDRYEVSRPVGKMDLKYSLEQEVKTTTGRLQQDQDISQIDSAWALNDVSDLKFTFRRLSNNQYGSEDRYKVAYSKELKDWTDIKLAYELVDKSQKTLGRDNYRILFTQHNPKKDTDIAVDLRLESYFDYKNTLLNLKYGLIY